MFKLNRDHSSITLLKFDEFLVTILDNMIFVDIDASDSDSIQVE